TDDEAVLELRARQQRNIIATMLISQGVPMLLHGDELGRTQNGNNNVYCQDSEIAWVDWSLAGKNAPLIGFTAGMVALRHAHPVFRRRRFFAGRPIGPRQRAGAGAALPDIAWFTPSGEEMTEQDWDSGFGKCVTVFLNGEGIFDVDARGERVVDDSFVIALNAHYEDIDVVLPGSAYGSRWAVVVDTTSGIVTTLATAPGMAAAEPDTVGAGDTFTVTARSLVVFQRTEGP
ncbi:glycogen debranching enzyme, partial [Pseudonocardia sp. KRD-184]|nr:glycogen debranching enzyme [Pseudonocardia oceani]MBW0099000.1 glycogen debranching enzyme [Pseudonocardia oceani]MBW0111499.1 glycogen debranching enzyme [Pseudonocardia oceani]MBW0125223.1 glycogen debranching enzyme [Pseudonocardia oceani]